MRRIFADTFYWVALASPRDQWHSSVLDASRNLRGHQIVTTEEVLSEFLTHFCKHGRKIREGSIHFVKAIQSDRNVVIEQQSHQSFLDGLAFYQARPDKGYSLADCISMITMRRYLIGEVLTHDDHFAQEGFILLL